MKSKHECKHKYQELTWWSVSGKGCSEWFQAGQKTLAWWLEVSMEVREQLIAPNEATLGLLIGELDYDIP